MSLATWVTLMSPTFESANKPSGNFATDWEERASFSKDTFPNKWGEEKTINDRKKMKDRFQDICSKDKLEIEICPVSIGSFYGIL